MANKNLENLIKSDSRFATVVVATMLLMAVLLAMPVIILPTCPEAKDVVFGCEFMIILLVSVIYGAIFWHNLGED